METDNVEPIVSKLDLPPSLKKQISKNYKMHKSIEKLTSPKEYNLKQELKGLQAQKTKISRENFKKNLQVNQLEGKNKQLINKVQMLEQENKVCHQKIESSKTK